MQELLRVYQEYTHTRYRVVPWHLRSGSSGRFYADLELEMAESSLQLAFDRCMKGESK